MSMSKWFALIILVRMEELLTLLRMASLIKSFFLTLLLMMTTAGTANAQTPTRALTSSPMATPVVIVEPDLWKIILVGKDCPAQVWSMMDLLQEELFAVLHSYVPESTFIPPGESTRNLVEDERGLVSTCPPRGDCSKPAFVGKCKMR